MGDFTPRNTPLILSIQPNFQPDIEVQHGWTPDAQVLIVFEAALNKQQLGVPTQQPPQAEDDILGSQIPVPKPLFPTIPSWVGGRSPKNLYRVVVSKDVLFSPLFVGDDPISQAYFLKGLKPPISYDIVNFDKPLRIQTPPD